MSKGFAPGAEARSVDAGALGRFMSGMRGGFALRDVAARPEGEAPDGPVSFSPAPPPKHFSPADPDSNPTEGWNPLDPSAAPADFSEPAQAFDAIAAARAEGFLEGQKAAVVGQESIDRLAAALARINGFDREALAGRLRQTVLYLVTRLVGETGVSGDLLAGRIKAAVDLIADSSEPALLRLNPDDLALVEGRFPDRVFAVADKAVERGGFLIETKTTVIEDGPGAWLAQLAAAIDRTALPDQG